VEEVAIPPLSGGPEISGGSSAPAPATSTPPPPSNNGKPPKLTGRQLPALPQGMTQADVDAMPDDEFQELKKAMLKRLYGNNPPPAQPQANAPPATGGQPATPAATQAAGTGSVRAVDLVDAAKYLMSLASPSKRPSPAGRIVLLREAASLLGQAQNADSQGMPVADQLGLINRQRAAQEDADAAVTELQNDFDRQAQLSWVDLSGTMQGAWSSIQGYTHWKSLDGGVFQSSGGDWDSMLHSRNPGYADLIFEGELQFSADDGDADIVLRDHNGSPQYIVEFRTEAVFLMYRKSPFELGSAIANHAMDIKPKTWIPIRISMDGDHCMIWVNHTKIIDAKLSGENTAGNVDLACPQGTVQFRHLRMRELN
ncbi:MAG: family 16 glycoside hydrolase, partial [Planctomycetota bacterium]